MHDLELKDQKWSYVRGTELLCVERVVDTSIGVIDGAWRVDMIPLMERLLIVVRLFV